MMVVAWIVFWLAAMTVLAFQRASLSVWTIGMGVFLILCSYFSGFHYFTLTVFWLIYLIIFGVLNLKFIRCMLLTKTIFSIYKKITPALSETEKEAINAGDIAWEGDLFSGMPDWKKLQAMHLSKLTVEEQAILNGPVEEFCTKVNNWKFNHDMQIPKALLDFLGKNGLLGMIIPKKFGGLEFSHFAHSQVITKLASASCGAAILTSVPNSLGPAELLMHYGTDEQKNYYLPRLANGTDIPCFALTSPLAGSDASSIEDYGVVCEAEFEGKKQLCMKLNWNKRYITLSPVATLLGLAFKLYDPEHLLGQKESIGITCALIPVHLKNVETGRRHFPLHSAFPNGPTRGKDVLVPLDYIIGGPKMAGHGWRMLMECLAAGRGISIPSMVTGGLKLATLATGAYTRIRRQFKMGIAKFGGIEEVLTRIASNMYAMEATRVFTVSILDQGKRAAVASAISKYHVTEMGRAAIVDAMDVHGGKGICMGPSNYLAQGYLEAPIGITVEGANILTRSMIIFGQGAIRCHPYVLKEMMAAQNANQKEGLKEFDQAIFGHLGFILSNKTRAFILGLTNGYFAKAPSGQLKRFYQKFSRFSACLAFLADVAMITMGGELKRAEKISARFGDILSYLYIGSAVLKYFEEQQCPLAEWPMVQWICQDLLFKMQTQVDGLLINLPNRWIARLCRVVVFPLGQYLRVPNDELGARAAVLITEPSEFRARLAKNIYYTPNDNNPGAKLEAVMLQVIAAEPLEKKLMMAKHFGKIQGKTNEELILSALQNKIISLEESNTLTCVFESRMSVVNVDDFSPDFFKS